ncbi:DUF362 domain-containing protein [Desulfolithobacter sp.]
MQSNTTSMISRDQTVALARCATYDHDTLLPCLDKVLRATAMPECRSLRVLLKPNLLTGRKGNLPCTEAAFILAVVRWFLDQGARVSLGDSPAFGSASRILARLGILEKLRSFGVRVTDFQTVREIVLPSGVRAGVAAEALGCDLLVNMPRVKAHAQMRMTMALKNCFGCLVGMRKPWWHMRHGGDQHFFARLLIELPGVLPDQIVVVDGITAMHTTGPIGGEPFSLCLIGAGRDPVAVDTALLAVIGVDPRTVPLWQVCHEQGQMATELGALHFPLCHPHDLRVTGFVAPEQLNPVRFNLFRFMKNSLRRILLRNSC